MNDDEFDWNAITAAPADKQKAAGPITQKQIGYLLGLGVSHKIVYRFDSRSASKVITKLNAAIKRAKALNRQLDKEYITALAEVI